MLKISHLTKSYGTQTLFQDVNFNINVKEKIGLVGRNGHGKSTLFRVLLQKEEPDEGIIEIPQDYKISTLEQHINFTQPTVRQEVCQLLSKTDPKPEVWQAEKYLFGLGFTSQDLEKSPLVFSGGYQIRINLVKCLLQEADLLLLDEPTNYLDIISLRWLQKFLQNWSREFVLITHDSNFMNQVTTHTLGIHRKTMRKMRGSTDNFYEQINLEEDVYEKTRKNNEQKRQKNTKFILNFRAGARSAGLVQSRIKMLNKLENSEQLTNLPKIKLNFPTLPFNADLMFRTEKINFCYKDGKNLIQNFSFLLQNKERIGIIGKNGQGKSTLLSIFANLQNITSGELQIHPALQIGYFGQSNIDSFDAQKTILEELQYYHKSSSEQKIRTVCASVLFTDDQVYKKMGILSGGEKCRVALAKVLLKPCHLLLLDEPSNHLDLESVEALKEALYQFSGTIILVTHNESILEKVATRLIVFDNILDQTSSYPISFNGGYNQFLEEQGWNEEINSINSKKIMSVEEKQEEREQQRVKQKKIKTLQHSVKKSEKEIRQTESYISEIKEKIEQTKKKGAILLLNDLSLEWAELENKLEKKYIELEKTLEEIDIINKAK